MQEAYELALDKARAELEKARVLFSLRHAELGSASPEDNAQFADGDPESSSG